MYILIACVWFLRHRLSIDAHARHRTPQGFSYTTSLRCPGITHATGHHSASKTMKCMGFVTGFLFCQILFVSHGGGVFMVQHKWLLLRTLQHISVNSSESLKLNIL